MLVALAILWKILVSARIEKIDNDDYLLQRSISQHVISPIRLRNFKKRFS